MRNFRFMFGVLLGAALLTGCSKDDSNDGGDDTQGDGKPTFLTVENAATPINKEYTEVNFTINVSTDAKAVDPEVNLEDQADANWCTAKYRAKDKQLKVSLTENRIKKDGERTAKIELKVPGLESVFITIVQAPSEVEHDPFEVDFGDETWNDSWVVDCYMHGTKYDPILFDNGTVSVTAPSKSYYQNTMGPAVTVALKLDTKFLEQFGGTAISKLELLSTPNPAVSIKFALMTSNAAVANDGSMPEYVTEFYTPNITIWESTTNDVTVGTNGWANCTCGSACVVPSSGNVFVVATITGGGEWFDDGKNKWGEFQWVTQVLNRFTPTYVNFTNANAQKLYKFVGGTAELNIHMAQ